MRQTISDERKDRLRRLAAAHDAWTMKHLAETPFHPEDHLGSGDYNVHYVDLEASAGAQREWMEISWAIMSIGPSPAGDATARSQTRIGP
ncbi:MAG: hypothetical protein WKF76_08925 [Nocardioidaceae bacterium]